MSPLAATAVSSRVLTRTQAEAIVVAFQVILWRMRELIRNRRHVVTIHALDEMISDDLTLVDIVSCLMTGEIVARQFDREMDHWKYLIEGVSVQGEPFVTVARIGPRDILYVITVYAL